MRKGLVVLSFLALMGGDSLVLAADNSWFIGGEFGGIHIEPKAKSTDSGKVYSAKATVNASYESIKVGKYFDYGRVYGNFGIQNKKKGFSSYAFGLNYDYTFDVDFPFAPFVGVTAGYAKSKLRDDDFFANKPDGFYYGAGLGAIYKIDKNLELEVGARYVGANIKDSGDGIDSWGDYVSDKIEVEDFTQYYLGLNYRF